MAPWWLRSHSDEILPEENQPQSGGSSEAESSAEQAPEEDARPPAAAEENRAAGTPLEGPAEERSGENREESGEPASKPPRRRRRRRRRRKPAAEEARPEPAASPSEPAPEISVPEEAVAPPAVPPPTVAPPDVVPEAVAPPAASPPAGTSPSLSPGAPAPESGSRIEAFARELAFAMPERGTHSEVDERNIAMFCDFENLALGARETEGKGTKFDINLVLERLLEKGKVIVKKAYADWQRYSEYKRPFHESAIELIDIPQKRYSGKNSADIKMVVDAMDLCYSKDHLNTFVIVSGDSDFSPLVAKLRENNKHVIGIGIKHSTSTLLVDNCDEFIYYEDLWRDAQKAPLLEELSPQDEEVFGLMIDAMLALMRENKEVLWGSMIKQTMKRKKPSFSEGYYGYSSFSELLEDAERKQVINLKRDRRAGTYVITGFARR